MTVGELDYSLVCSTLFGIRSIVAVVGGFACALSEARAAGIPASQLVVYAYRISSILWGDLEVVESTSLVRVVAFSWPNHFSISKFLDPMFLYTLHLIQG